MQSLPIRGAWIEIALALRYRLSHESLPIRGAWIEIHNPVGRFAGKVVAPHAGTVSVAVLHTEHPS